ncbi:hypothetical protein ABPG75_013995 [Micractinium tetrahymenae]
MDRKFSAGQAGVDALTSSLNSRMQAQQGAQGAAGATSKQEGDALERAVDVFYRRVMADPSLEPFFRTIDMKGQRHKMSTFMLYILGGEEAYTGRDMWEVHKDMVQEQGLRRRHFDAVLQHMKDTLDEMGAPADVAQQAVEVIKSTLPEFRFPPEEDGGSGERQSGAPGPAGGRGIGRIDGDTAAGSAGTPGTPGTAGTAWKADEAPVKVGLQVLPGGGSVLLRLLPAEVTPREEPSLARPPASASTTADDEAPLAVCLEVLPDASTVMLRLLPHPAPDARAAGAARAAVAAPAPPQSPAVAGPRSEGSAEATQQGTSGSDSSPAPVSKSSRERPPGDLPEDEGGSCGGSSGAFTALPAAAQAPEGSIQRAAEGSPRLEPVSAAAPAGGAAGSSAGSTAGAARHPVPDTLEELMASDDPDLQVYRVLFLPEPGEELGMRGSAVARRQLLQFARERWAMLSAGLLAGPRMAASVAVWAAAAALVGAHLMAVLAPLGPAGSRQ